MPRDRMCQTLRLYHGTPGANVKCILKEGLKSKCEAPEAVTSFKGWVQEKDLIWFTDDYPLATHHAYFYEKEPGVVLTADVEICDPIDWDEPLGVARANKIVMNSDNLPCDDYVKRTYAEGVSPETDGSDAIVRIAERCMKESKGMGEIMKLLGFGSFRQRIPKDRWLNRGAMNYAVTDGTPIEIVESKIVTEEID